MANDAKYYMLGKQLACILPRLDISAAQDEDIIQIILFIVAELQEEIAKNGDVPCSLTIISVGEDLSGWTQISSFFSNEILQFIFLEKLAEPLIPNIAIANHKPAYDLFEYLKNKDFDEIHLLDRCGYAYYITQAKKLGLYFLDTILAVHIVGSTIFHKEAEDELVDELGFLMDDLLERGSVERADVIYIHDNKAWNWYRNKIEISPNCIINNVSYSKSIDSKPSINSSTDDTPLKVIFYGSLGADRGLSLFCDAAKIVLSKIARPIEFFFVGSPQSVGGMDAVSYIHLRSSSWGVPITIKRDLNIAQESAYLFSLGGIVVCNNSRKEGLRSRLLTNSSLKILRIGDTYDLNQSLEPGIIAANPGRIALAVIEIAAKSNGNCSQSAPRLMDLWSMGRLPLPTLENINPSLPLKIIPREQEPKVSVCITHFSRPKKLCQALISLKNQTYHNFEVIVADDGSPDEEVQQELIRIKSEIKPLGWRLVVQENRYLGAARNFALSHAQGDYILFMDDDNCAKPQEISNFVAVAQRTNADIVTSFYDGFETDADLETDNPPKVRFTPFGSDPTLGAYTNCYGDANALYRREVLEKLGGYREDYGITHEDWELFCRASLAGFKIICIPEPLFWYRIDPDGMYRGLRAQLHKSSDLKRHIRVYTETLPYYQAKLVLLAQGLIEKLPTTVDSKTRSATAKLLGINRLNLPYARVAIITRTKDRPLLLRRAIRSALDQTFQDWLLVIINDGGDLEALELVVEEVREELAGRILVLHNPISMGMQTASNIGISNCDSDFIIVHDDDDSWKPDFLASTVSHLDNHGWEGKLGGVVTWSEVIVEEINDYGEITRKDSFIFNDRLYSISLVELSVENRFPPISFLFRRTAMESVGAFDPEHDVLGDWDFHLRVLQKFNIDVIPEPLANYHHRTQSTTGNYSNSVHAQSQVHQAKRINLLNGILRQEMAKENGLSFAQMLVLGDFHQVLLKNQNQQFKNLNDYIWRIEQFFNYYLPKIEQNVGAANNLPEKNFSSRPLKDASAFKSGRNLIKNGDFRLWDKQIVANAPPYTAISPNILVSYNGYGVSYRITQQKCQEINGDGDLRLGQSYLHLENDGSTKNGTFFFLEFIVPSALIFAGEIVCISGISRLEGANTVNVSARHFLRKNYEFDSPRQKIILSNKFQAWNCSLTYPSIEETELEIDHHHRIFLMFPCDIPFQFDLTEFQVELGDKPTEFEYL